jgi:hypothetical protein
MYRVIFCDYTILEKQLNEAEKKGYEVIHLSYDSNESQFIIVCKNSE